MELQPRSRQEPLDEAPMYVHISSSLADAHPEYIHLSEGVFVECRASTCLSSCTGLPRTVFQEPAPEVGLTRAKVAYLAEVPVHVLSLTEALAKPSQSVMSGHAAPGHCSPPWTLDAAGPEFAKGPLPENLLEYEFSEAGKLPVPGLPSLGSVGHSEARCKPCAFYHSSGCVNGVSCTFCHFCEAGERQRRKKNKREIVRTARRFRKAAAAA